MSGNEIKVTITTINRPNMPEYGISENLRTLLSWDKVNEWMDLSKNYWIATTKSDGKPHTRPIWGIWHNNLFYFGGGQKTSNVKNLLRDSRITVHTERADNVVIIEGKAEQFEDEEMHKILGIKYEIRYGLYHPPPFWRVVPKIVFAWTMDDFANTPTKFKCQVE